MGADRTAGSRKDGGSRSARGGQPAVCRCLSLACTWCDALARSSARTGALEVGLYPVPALVAGGGLGRPFQGVMSESGLRIRPHRRHHLQGSCRRDLSKRGLEAHAIGRSRGGLTTKIHAAVDALGLPIRVLITPGHWGDCPQARGLLEGLEGVGHVIADAGYDADHLRDFIAGELGAVAQIKQNTTRSGSKLIDWALYKERNLVERFFNRIKRFRRIALRCEKTVAAFNGFVSLACAMAWLA